MAVTVLRQEEKYLLTAIEALGYTARLSALLRPDKFSRGGSYMVRSLYFDTPDDKDFFDKVTEQNLRRKIRLRIYAPGASTAKLELKQKENVYQKKRSLTVSREDALALTAGDYSVLLRSTDPFAGELFAIMTSECYRPKTIVEYQRLAFMRPENNIRLTFDSHIQATESSRDLFSDNLPLYPVFDPGSTVFEVKYNGFLFSYISDIISQIDRRQLSSSKYCMARSVGYPLQL